MEHDGQLDIQQMVPIDLLTEVNSRDCTTAIENVLINPASFIPPMGVQSPFSCKYEDQYVVVVSTALLLYFMQQILLVYLLITRHFL